MANFLKKLVYIISALLLLSGLLSVLGIFTPPSQWTVLAFFSISFPLIYIGLILSTIAVVSFSKKWFFVLGFSTLLLSVFLPRFYQFNSFEKAVPKNHLKVMSYNVRLFNLYDWKNNIKTRNQIFEFIRKENPDIACFQEFYHQDNSSHFPTKDTLLKFMDWNHYHERYTHEMRHQQYFGVATFSRFPIVNRGSIAFDNDDNNFCIYSDLVKENDTLRVFNAHIGSIRFKKEDYAFFGDQSKIHPEDKEGNKILSRLYEAFVKRSDQIDAIAEEIRNSPYKVILCLDMNDSPMSYAYQQINHMLTDAFRTSGSGTGATYIGKVPSFRIDYIFHSPELQSGSFTTHEEKLSDHRAISCKIY